MPKGPQGQKRPADAIGLAVLVGKIATGEATDDVAAALPRKATDAGGNARAKSLTPEQRRDIARLAADARWKKS